MAIEYIRNQLLSIPQIEQWPEMVKLINRKIDKKNKPCWEYPLLSAQAVGAPPQAALPATIPVFCLLYSIHIVDDMLDHEPDGLHEALGAGEASNISVAFQAAATYFLKNVDLDSSICSFLCLEASASALKTAFGQNIDLKLPRHPKSLEQREADYWRIVETKTPPLFAFALAAGAALGGAEPALAISIGKLGSVLGHVVQISDDLKDAIGYPPAPDWQSRWNNLAILYALMADHPDRKRFQELLKHCQERDSLREAQDILVRSGAVSYCCYQMLEHYRAYQQRLQELDLADPEPLEDLIEHHIAPLKKLLEMSGSDDRDMLLRP